MKPHTVSTSLALALTLLGAACHSTSPDAAPASDANARTATANAAMPTEGPVAALAYSPDDSPTGRRIAEAQSALTERPDVDRHLALATLLMRRGRETSNAVLMRYAEDVVDSAKAIDPHDTRVTLLNAMIQQDAHRFDRAAELARQVLAVDPDDSTAHLVLGDAQLELGDYEGALDSVQAALDIHPDLRSYNRGAHLKWLMGDFDSALAIMELALDAGSPRDPESSAWCFVDLGTMFLHRGDAPRAKASAERALNLVPDYLPGQVLMAKALARADERGKAIELMAAAVERKPSVEDLLLLSEWHRAEGQADVAQQRWDQADRLAEDDPRPMALYLARHDMQTERAVTLARAEVAARKNIAAHDAMAMALARAGKHDEALESMRKALELGTRDATLHLHASLVHTLAGRIDQARVAFDTANRIDADADVMLADELRRRMGAA